MQENDIEINEVEENQNSNIAASSNDDVEKKLLLNLILAYEVEELKGKVTFGANKLFDNLFYFCLGKVSYASSINVWSLIFLIELSFSVELV